MRWIDPRTDVCSFHRRFCRLTAVLGSIYTIRQKMKYLFRAYNWHYILNESKLVSYLQVFWFKSKPHGDRYILSFVHVFRNVTRVYFAYCVPYTYSQLQEFLRSVDARGLRFWRRDPLCMSVVSGARELVDVCSEVFVLAKASRRAAHNNGAGELKHDSPT